jgi:hypothetical protein
VRRLALVVVVSCLASACLVAGASAATLQPLGNFKQPIFVTSDPVDPERLLVVERGGAVIEAGAGGTRVVADLSPWVSCCTGERGLLSIAPAPDFAGSGRFYAAYTGTPAAGGQEGDVHVDSFRLDSPGPNQVIREPILTVAHALHPNHNGGQLQLGPDGYLYIALGDGGGSGDPLGSGQDTEVLLGKVLRIDPRPGQVPAYAVPAGNPFVGGPGRDEIWAYGLRNPWRFSFDRTSGDMVIADVGQGLREEVDHAPSPAPGAVGGGGANYGWSCREGFIAFPGAPGECTSATGFTEPVFDYPHEDPGTGAAHGCSIIGGYVVRDPGLGDLHGRYVYTDFCTREIRSLVLPAGGGPATGDRSEGLAVAAPASFGEDSCGRLYVVSGEGTVYRLVGSSPSVCAPAAVPIDKKAIRRPRQARLQLSAAPLGSSGARFKIRARLSPCGTAVGSEVRLKRGGHRLAAKRLNRRCIARFRTRVDRRSTFRAVLGGGASPRIRSPRLVISLPSARGE